MADFESLIATLDYILDTKERRHILGGILLSVSALFAGLAITAMTIDGKEIDHEQKNNKGQLDI